MTGGIGLDLFFADVEFDVGKLAVGDGEAAHLPILRKQGADPTEVDVGIFAAGTMAHIDGELEHGESVGEQVLAEVGGGFAFFLGFGGQVEKY